MRLSCSTSGSEQWTRLVDSDFMALREKEERYNKENEKAGEEGGYEK
jgi:hypothetical protein